MKYFKIGFAFLLLVNFISVQNLLAHPLQGHVVSIQEVQKQVGSQASQRISNIQEIQKLLRHSEIQKQLGDLFDLQKIEAAVINLDDDTLEDLAEQSRLANDQLQAGNKVLNAVIIAALIIGLIIGISALVYYGNGGS